MSAPTGACHGRFVRDRVVVLDRAMIVCGDQSALAREEQLEPEPLIEAFKLVSTWLRSPGCGITQRLEEFLPRILQCLRLLLPSWFVLILLLLK